MNSDAKKGKIDVKREMFVEIDGKSYKVKSQSLRTVLKRAVELPDMAEKVNRRFYLVVTGENGEAGIGGFVHLVTRDWRRAKRRLRDVVKNLGFDWLKKGTNDGDEHADERYDRDGTVASVNTYGCGVSFEATIKEIADEDFEKEDCW